jgi:hypothetical protein
MRRRTALLGIGTNLLTLAGCPDSVTLGESEPARPAELVDYSFATDVDTGLPADERGPRITADRGQRITADRGHRQ